MTGAANVAGAISTLQTASSTIHQTAWGVYGGDTYVVNNATGTNGAQASTVVVLKGLTSTTTGALSFTNGGFNIGSTNNAIAIDSGASKTFAIAISEVFTSAYSAAYTITQTAGAAGSVTLTGATASGSIILTGGTGTSTINVSGTSGTFTALTGGAGVDTITTGSGTAAVTGAAGNDVITLTAHGTNVQTIVLADTAANNGVDTITGFVKTTDILSWVQGVTEVDGATAFTSAANKLYQLGGQAAGKADLVADVAAAFNTAAGVTAHTAATTSWIAISDDNSTSIWAWVDAADTADEVNVAELTLVATIGTAMSTTELGTAFTI